MKKLLNHKFFLVSALAVTMSLSACGGDEKASKDKEENPAEKDDGMYSLDDFSPTIEPEGEPIEGGTLKVGLVSDTPFDGLLNTIFYSGTPDGNVLDWFYGDLVSVDEAFNFTDELAATIKPSEDFKTYTITIKEDVRWHDGEPLKAEDLAFAHEVIAHPDYTGVRYDASFQNIEGAAAYHDGEADHISGINVIDDKTLEITYLEAWPSLMAGGIWTSPMAKHIFEDIPISEMAESPEVREHPIGFGPFKVEKIIPGESVTYTKNEDYWEGEPLIDRVELRVIDPSVAVEALQSGEIDMTHSNDFPSAQFVDNADMSNVNWVGRPAPGYSYIGFKLGTWDAEKGTVVTDPSMKMADPALRKAMAHALDREKIANSVYKGIRYAATTIISPYHSVYHNADDPGLAYDLELANKLLDEAGYEYDGEFRTTPDGEELTISFAHMSGDAINETLANSYIQSWKKIGLNVELLDGRLHEFNSFYDRVGHKGDDDPAIDIYAGGWSMGYDVDPSSIWGPNAVYNFTRYTDEKMQDIIARGVSKEAFDVDHRRKVYNEWQAYFQEAIPAFPTFYEIGVQPINKRVSGYTFEIGNYDYGYHTLQLNAEKPVVDK